MDIYGEVGANKFNCHVSNGYIIINHLEGAVLGAAFLMFWDRTRLIGHISQNSNTRAVSYSTTSDYRIKENVQPLEYSLNIINKLKPCSFTYLGSDEKQICLIAHEAQEICPYTVSGTKDETMLLCKECLSTTCACPDKVITPKYQGIDYGKFSGLLI